MTLYVLLGDCNVRGTILPAGKLIDDAVTNVGEVIAARGELAIYEPGSARIQQLLRRLRQRGQREPVDPGGPAVSALPPDARAVVQATWHVHAAAGSDDADGLTPATALRSVGELTRRWGFNRTLAPPSGSVDVFLDTDFPAADPLVLKCYLADGVSLKFHGARTVVRAGSLTAATIAAPLTNTPYQLTDALVSSWAADLGRLVTVTSGADLGACCWPEKDLGAGAARTTTPQRPLATTRGAFAGGEAYSVSTLSALTIGSLEVRSANPRSAGAQVVFDGLSLSSTAADVVEVTTVGCRVSFFECRFNGVFSPIGDLGFANTVANCWANAGVSYQGSWQHYAGAAKSFLIIQGGAFVAVRNDAMVSHGQVQVASGGRLQSNGLCVFDSTNSSAFSLTAQSAASLDSGVLWGSGNSGFGVAFNGAGFVGRKVVLGSPNPAVLTGAGGDFVFAGGVSQALAFDPTVPGYVGGGPGPNGERNLTWANLDAAVAGGGFGGQVFSPLTLDGIAKTS